ncbi:hypothetical protein BDV18DRAFT_55828 [Aspergillus unguis]
MGENATDAFFLRNIWAISYSYLCVSVSFVSPLRYSNKKMVLFCVSCILRVSFRLPVLQSSVWDSWDYNWVRMRNDAGRISA